MRVAGISNAYAINVLALGVIFQIEMRLVTGETFYVISDGPIHFGFDVSLTFLTTSVSFLQERAELAKTRIGLEAKIPRIVPWHT